MRPLEFALVAGCLWVAVAGALRVFKWVPSADAGLTPIPSKAEQETRHLLRAAAGAGRRRRLRRYLEQCGSRRSPFFVWNCAAALFFAVLAVSSLYVPDPWLPFAPALAAAGFPWIVLARLRKRRLRQFEAQFSDALEFASRALRVGHGLNAAIEMVANGFGEPLGAEFRRVFDELREGESPEAAVKALAARAPVPDIEFFVAAVLVHERTNGNLGETLNKLASVLRARSKLRARMRAATAHGRITALAVSAIPLAATGLMYFVDRSQVLFFFTDATGRMLLACAIVLQSGGYLLVRKLSVLR